MPTRAVVCIGVDRAGYLPPLQAAGQGARQVAQWATAQGCAVSLLTDEQHPVSVACLFEAVWRFVEAGTYEQLIIYFSGHGILTAPGTEYWLLSGAPHNPNEAVNLFRAVEDARDAGIPHIVFISDACRSTVAGPPLSGVSGGTIFPNRGLRAQRGEVDVFYATRPGDPAWEVPAPEAVERYQGLFTAQLLRTLHQPHPELVEVLAADGHVQQVLTSRRLKPYLEAHIPQAAGAVDVRLRQCPEIRVETALPKYLARVATGTVPEAAITGSPLLPLGHYPPPQRTAAHGEHAVAGHGHRVAQLLQASQLAQAEPGTGFIVVGTRLVHVRTPGWIAVPGSQLGMRRRTNQSVRLVRHSIPVEPGAALLQFAEGTGALLAILPGFVGAVVVEQGRVVSVNYVPTHRVAAASLSELEHLKAHVAEEARQGVFEPLAYAAQVRDQADIDPTLALYAAYGYAQAGASQELMRLYASLQETMAPPPLFDLLLLAGRYQPTLVATARRTARPAAPMLAQGWAVLTPDHPLHRGWLEQLRPTLLPALWTTYSAAGVSLLDSLITTAAAR